MSLPMKCETCRGRWVALSDGGSVSSRYVTHVYLRESVQCPRCGAEGVIDDDVLIEHQRHPDAVATTRVA